MSTARTKIQLLRLETEKDAVTPSRLADILDSMLQEMTEGGSSQGSGTQTDPGNDPGSQGSGSQTGSGDDGSGSQGSGTYKFSITLSELCELRESDDNDVNYSKTYTLQPGNTVMSLRSRKFGLTSKVSTTSPALVEKVTIDAQDVTIPDDLQLYKIGSAQYVKDYTLKADLSAKSDFGSSFEGAGYMEKISIQGSPKASPVYTSMFYGCSSLKSIELTAFTPGDTTRSSDMFAGCVSLKTIKCTDAFKQWCLQNAETIALPTAMQTGGTGTWETV